MSETFEIFLSCVPGLENVLAGEVRGKGFKRVQVVPGGVTLLGGWPEVWRANLWVRGAGRVLARLAHFRAGHLNQLEQQVRRAPWGNWLRPELPFRVEAVCAKSRIYHSGAAEERIARAISAATGARHDDAAEITIMARIERDICTLSLDTSGAPLHRRGYKLAVNQAPMRETLAALFLMRCGYTGAEPLYDPMCGSGTFVIEAAEIAARLNPGRNRSFAFEQFANFDAAAWQAMRAVRSARTPAFTCTGSDRDAAAVEMSRQNALRAGVDGFTTFRQNTISDATPPEGPVGLVIVNPPYGERIGDSSRITALYRALGQTLKSRFAGWRVGLITSEAALAHATTLPFLPNDAPVPHGGLRVTLYQTAALPN